MRTKKIALAVTLLIFSVSLSATLGYLRFLELVEGKLQPGLFLIIASIMLSYFVAIIIFLLDFSDKKNLIKTYYVIALLFGVIFHLAQTNAFLTILASLSFFAFLFYLYKATLIRSELFTRFVPRDIFAPVVKRGIFFLLATFALIGFFQTKTLMQDGKITAQLVRIVSRPIVTIVNKQLGAQLQKQLGGKFEASIGTQNREQIVRFVLQETLESMSEGETRQFMGFRTDTIPLDRTVIFPNGAIDLTPVVDAMAPEIAKRINETYGNFLIFVPFAVAILIVLFLQPLFIPFHIAANILFVPVIFWILRTSGFIVLRKETIEVERLSL